MILGCTHYPLIRPMLQRMLGRGVEIVTSGSALARQVEHALSARALGSPRADGEGDYRFLCTGDVDAFRALGTRFLQLPLGDVEHVALRAGARGMTALLRPRRRTSCGPTTIEPGFVRTATGSALITMGETRVICTASHQDGVPKWLAGQRARLGHRGVRDAPGVDRRAQAARRRRGAGPTAARSRSSG